MSAESYITIILALIGIIAALIGAHYLSMIRETRENRKEISTLKDLVNANALSSANAIAAAANAVASAAQTALMAIGKKEERK